MLALSLATCACGSTHLSETAFRAKANAVCRRLNQQANSTSSSTISGFRKSLARVDAGINELARLKPPPRDEARYNDFLLRLRKLFAFARAKGPELIALMSEIEKAVPQRVGAHPSRRALRRYERLTRKLTAIEVSVHDDARRVDADARAVHLPACVAGASGG
jgi:hypothetical protein